MRQINAAYFLEAASAFSTMTNGFLSRDSLIKAVGIFSTFVRSRLEISVAPDVTARMYVPIAVTSGSKNARLEKRNGERNTRARSVRYGRAVLLHLAS